MIRLFTPKDEESCRRILERCFDLNVSLGRREREHVKKVYTQEGYLQSKALRYPLFVFEEGGLVLAMGGVERNQIKKLYVDPDNQERGIGSAVLEHLEQIAISQGYKELVLCCFDNSINFYERNGYVRVDCYFEECEGGIRIPLTKMVKHIP